ncbi:10672_t:CDS:2, partial [Racocetra persica]
MGRNKDLTEAECFTVKKLKKEGMSAAKIARILAQREHYNWAKEHKNWTKKIGDVFYRLTNHLSALTQMEKFEFGVAKKNGRKLIMVWGCVNGYNLLYLVRCPPRMNGEAYGEIIVDA